MVHVITVSKSGLTDGETSAAIECLKTSNRYSEDQYMYIAYYRKEIDALRALANVVIYGQRTMHTGALLYETMDQMPKSALAHEV